MADFVIQADAPFAGREIRSLSVPAIYILVHCSDGKRVSVPQANTRLEEPMRITVVISPEASQALEMLRQGCEAKRKRKRRCTQMLALSSLWPQRLWDPIHRSHIATGITDQHR